LKKVKFHVNNHPLKLAQRNLLRNFIENIFDKEGFELGSLNIIFCNDQELLKLNKKFLKHDYYTDILTFDLSFSTAIEGEIYLSLSRVKANSIHLDIPFSEELYRVLIHGVLHLTGYNDKTKSDKIRMEKRQELYLRQYLRLIKNVSRGTGA
jgi:rRNA maturation RNase YbeY